MNTINCDDNGSYVKFGCTRKSYWVSISDNKITQATTVRCDDNGKDFYKQRVGWAYVNSYVPTSEVYTIYQIGETKVYRLYVI